MANGSCVQCGNPVSVGYLCDACIHARASQARPAVDVLYAQPAKARRFEPLTLFFFAAVLALGSAGVFEWPQIKNAIQHTPSQARQQAVNTTFGILSGKYKYHNPKHKPLDGKAALEMRMDHSFSHTGTLLRAATGVRKNFEGSYKYNPVDGELILSIGGHSLELEGHVTNDRITLEIDRDGYYELVNEGTISSPGYTTVRSNTPSSGPLLPPANSDPQPPESAPIMMATVGPVAEGIEPASMEQSFGREAEHTLADFLNDYCRQRAATLNRGIEIIGVTWLVGKLGVMVVLDEGGAFRQGTASYTPQTGWRWLLPPNYGR